VIGHWTIGLIWWRGGLIGTSSAIGVTSWMWLATWVLQIMPVFFFVGGFANLVAYESHRRRGLSTGSFIRGRVDRLLRPSIVFFASWIPAMVVLHIADIGTPAGPRIWGATRLLRGVLPPGATVPFGPLWFLAVYLVVVMASPLTLGSPTSVTPKELTKLTLPKLFLCAEADRYGNLPRWTRLDPCKKKGLG